MPHLQSLHHINAHCLSVFQSYEASTKHCGRIGNRTNDHRCSDGQSLVKIGTDYLAWIVYLALFPQQ
ncbi:hypothetical protein PGTUg99_028717 [Puccinia graminis f. sp. tritici]|uniref:Uncharacterized protein n=1 Tax=Puccinia graminis f. sp. tritici TaxID=56615 RepID=A0A5B0RU55_PUCGR|nr:hypothetical protein PGTUg99_028717 [Puccinia graminis f. sp. tritici]